MATNNLEVMRSADGSPGPGPGPGGHRVHVVISVQDGEIRVDPPVFEVYKHLDQEVRWTCTAGNGEFMVEFDDSPFYESQFSKDAPVSGLARRAILPDDHKVYNYTVRVGEKFLDPGGVIRKNGP